MIAASQPIQRPSNARLLAVDSTGGISHHLRSEFVRLLRPGDLVIANDAATLPASLALRHVRTGRAIEVRLAGRRSLHDLVHFKAVIFGEGDFRTRTEHRPPPPVLLTGDCLESGALRATVTQILNHPRFITLRFEGAPREIWEGLARRGRPIQYAHIPEPLALWDTWTPIAGLPAAFEPPSAGFTLNWEMLGAMATRGIQFATVTHTAGISSTGDDRLDALLPLDEPYRIPESTATRIQATRAAGNRIVAVGTTVVRALEHSGARAGEGVANQKIGPLTRLRVVDAILSGTHEPDTSHHALLRAFTGAGTLKAMDLALESHAYRTHEFGDSILVEAHLRGARPGKAKHTEVFLRKPGGAHLARKEDMARLARRYGTPFAGHPVVERHEATVGLSDRS